MECPICKTSQAPAGGNGKIAICQSCGSGWVLHPPSVAELRQWYKNGVFGDHQIVRSLTRSGIRLARCQAVARWRFIIEGLGNFNRGQLRGKLSVCDVGAGEATALEAARYLKLDIDYCGIESSPRLFQRVRRLGGEPVKDFFELPEQRRFDLILANHILEHYPNPDDFLCRVRRLLSPGGTAFFEVPCLDYEFKKDLRQHLLFFSKRGFQAAIERNGFKILRIEEAGKTRAKMREISMACAGAQPFRRKIKNFLPPAVVHNLQNIYHLARACVDPFQNNYYRDCAREDVYREWGLESYGQDRCWIRALFTPAPPANRSEVL